MHYIYLRVSSHKQSVKNQYFEIQKWCEQRNIHTYRVIAETMSGAISPDYRQLGILLKKAQKGDCLIIAEISRLGRSILQIMSVLHQCMERGITIYSIKENYELGDNLNSKVLTFAFSLSVEIERHLISQRTKEALSRIKSEGGKLGRPKGIAPLQSLKLYENKDSIIKMYQNRIPMVRIAKRFNVNRKTLACFLKRLGLL